VLDQRQLRVDDEVEVANSGRQASDREWWEQKHGSSFLGTVDRVFELLNGGESGAYQPNFNRRYVGVLAGHRGTMFIMVQSRRNRIKLGIQVSDATAWVTRFEDAGVDSDIGKRGRLVIQLNEEELEEHVVLVGEVVSQAEREYRE